MDQSNNAYLWIAILAPIVVILTIYFFKRTVSEPNVKADRKYFIPFYFLASMAPSFLVWATHQFLGILNLQPQSTNFYFPFIFIGIPLAYYFIFSPVVNKAMVRDTNRWTVHAGSLAIFVLVTIIFTRALPIVTKSSDDFSNVEAAMGDVHTAEFFYVLFTLIIFFLVYSSKPTFTRDP